jgi:hypothetical protein
MKQPTVSKQYRFARINLKKKLTEKQLKLQNTHNMGTTGLVLLQGGVE